MDRPGYCVFIWCLGNLKLRRNDCAYIAVVIIVLLLLLLPISLTLSLSLMLIVNIIIILDVTNVWMINSFVYTGIFEVCFALWYGVYIYVCMYIYIYVYIYISIYIFFFFHEPRLSNNLHNMQTEVFNLLDTTQLKHELCRNKCNFHIVYIYVYE